MKRREFLKTVCIASACVLPACKSTVEYAPSHFKNGRLMVEKQLFNQVNSVTIRYQDDTLGIIKLIDNTYAASLMTCTHQGCGIAHETGGYICPCHGARFNPLGQVIKGPAKINLTRFDTSTDRDFVYIHLPKVRQS